MKIKYYNLVDDFKEYNSWKSDESFSTKGYNVSDLTQNFSIKEYIYEGFMSNRSQDIFEVKIKVFKEAIKEKILSNKNKAYLFVIEPCSNIISKIRSYKGLLNKNIVNISNYIEKEYILNEKESRIAAVIEITNSNFDYITTHLFDSATSFTVTSKNNYISEDFLNHVISFVQMKGCHHINLFPLILEYGKNENRLYRIGGNDGEDYWSLQEFSFKT